MKFSRERIEARRQNWPPECLADLLSLGSWEGGVFEVAGAAYTAFIDRWQMKRPPLLQMAAHLATAAVRWAGAGMPLVSPEVHARRIGLGGCADCRFYAPHHRRGGAAVCLHSRCGCNIAAKAWLATESCPDTPPRWPAE